MKKANQPITPVFNDKGFPSFFEGEPNYGLTKREYFAGLAMQGLLSIYNEANGYTASIEPNEENVKYMAALSVKASDELLKQLEK